MVWTSRSGGRPHPPHPAEQPSPADTADTRLSRICSTACSFGPLSAQPRLAGGTDEHSALVLLDVAGRTDPDELVRRLRTEHRAIIDTRADALRISPHFYNTDDDVDYLLDALSKILR